MRTEVPEGIDSERLAAVCRQYGISALFLFGSFARGDASASSDVDVLYELRPGARLGWEIEDLADALEEIFARPV
jgi:predicted nucleotidyltransferase